MERIRQFLNKNIYIFSVRQGLLLTIPFLILGSFSMVIMQFPLKAWVCRGQCEAAAHGCVPGHLRLPFLYLCINDILLLRGRADCV